MLTKFDEANDATREKLDPRYFIALDDNELNQGSRDVLAFSKTPSFENAFFIVPEKPTMLKKVLYVHTSVNLLNSFIPEIC